MIALGLLLDANKSANQRRFHGRAICADDISDAKRHVYRQITSIDPSADWKFYRRCALTGGCYDTGISARQHLETNLQEIRL